MKDDSSERYGLGVSITQTQFGLAYGHEGWYPGYRTIMRYFPEHKISVAMQVNTDTVNPGLRVAFDALVRSVLSSKKTGAHNGIGGECQ